MIEDIKKYKAHQIEDDVEAVKAVDASIEALRDDIVKYLKEANDTYYIDEEGKPKEAEGARKKSFWGSLGKAMKMLKSKKKGPSRFEKEKAKAKIKKSKDLWDVYDDMKKSFEMVRW